MLSQKHLISVFVILLTAFPGAAQAEFVKIGSANPPGLWLARGNNEWYTSMINGWRVFDDDFNQTSMVITLVGAVRGLDYDPVNDRMVLMAHDAGAINFHSLDGSFLGRITGVASGNDVSVDPRDGSIWVAIFGGAVRHYSSAGTLLSSFNTGFFLTGIAIDSINDTLLLLRADGTNGPLDDELYEFSTDGRNLGRLWDSSVIEGNGLGLEYIPELGQLYVTSGLPGDSVTIFRDRSRVPEPSTVTLSIAFVLLALLPRAVNGPARLRHRDF